jgi:tetratricopeptide (TPR) repeat protein
MRAITLAIVATLAAAGCQKEDAEAKGFEGRPPGEIKNVEEAYPELPPVEVPGLEGLADTPPLNYDLTEVMHLPSDWGTPAQRRLLSDRGFVVTDETYRQICSFYTLTGRPTFITTDSALYAYFLNLDDGVYRLELAQADRLPELLEKLRGRLAEESAKYQSGVGDAVWKKAARDLEDYLLVAETLTYADTKGAIPKGTPAEVASEIELILAAKGPAASPLRGVPLDYSRFQPRGLYAKESHGVWERRGDGTGFVEKRPGILRTYYRAVTWLHDVPFRVSDENETLQALLLAALDVALGPEESPLSAFNAPYVEFLGPSDDPGIIDYRKVYLKYAGSFDLLASDVEGRKKAYAAVRELPPPRHTTIPEAAAVEDPVKYKGLRFIPRPALYENEIFRPLCPYGVERSPASGEELFAVMGSRAAQEIVKGREARRLPGYDELFAAAVVAAKEAEKTYDTEICRKRRALYRALLDTPEDSKLPPYYRHSAWRYKDLNTCLAGWAHQRYIWDLHGKRTMAFMGGTFPAKTVVVEPNVAFFQTLAELSRESARFFDRHGVKDHEFDGLAKLGATLAVIASRQIEQKPLDSVQRELLEQYGKVLANFCGFYNNLEDEYLPDTSFCVPVGVDLYTGNERVVGQGRPRAIYVICEREGQKLLARGGVLSYRDWVGPAWGEGKVTERRWLALAADDELKAPAWQEEFSVPGAETLSVAAEEEAEDYDAEDCLSIGGNCLERGDYKDALKWYERGLALEPEDLGLNFGKVASLAGLGCYEEAEESLFHVFELRPDDWIMQYMKGYFLARQDRPEEAVESLDRALELYDRGYPSVVLDFGGGEAGEAGEKGLISFVHFIKANALYKLGRLEEALACYDRAIKLFDAESSFRQFDLYDAYEEKINVLKEMGRLEDALEAYDEALTRFPEDEDLRRGKGEVLLELGR